MSGRAMRGPPSHGNDVPQSLVDPKGGTLAEDRCLRSIQWLEASMGGIIYLVGLIVIVMFILSFFGLR